MILKFSKFILEGKYDQITGIAVDELWKAIKLTRISFDLKDPKSDNKYLKIDIDYIFCGSIEFDLTLKIKRDENYKKSTIIPKEYGFYLDGKSDALVGSIDIIIEIDPNMEPACYSNLNSMLQDVVRHEIEHLTHDGYNRLSDRPDPKDTDDIRYNIDGENSFLYFILADELGPMVHGMYRKAKTDKKPITTIFNEFLDLMMKNKIITNDKKELIFGEWTKEAKRLLPNAKFE